MSRTTFNFAFRTVLLDLGDVPAHGAPTFDLAFIVRTATAEVIATVPLKPAARILVIDPALLAPDGEWHGRIYAKIVELRIAAFGRQLRAAKPGRRELRRAVSHVLPAEHAEFQHFFGSEIRFEGRMEVFADGFGAEVNVVPLHSIVDFDTSFAH